MNVICKRAPNANSQQSTEMKMDMKDSDETWKATLSVRKVKKTFRITCNE